MMGVDEFVLARIAEDEEAARAATAGGWVVAEEIDGIYAGKQTVVKMAAGDAWTRKRILTMDQTRAHIWQDGEANVAHVVRWDPERVLTECAVKRAVVESYRHVVAASDTLEPGPRLVSKGMERGLHIALVAMARAYAHHPDFDAGWTW